MKVLTLWQPWASLIAAGVKTIETRSWRTSYRGPVAIHAGARFHTGAWPPGLLAAVDDLCGIANYPAALPRSAVVTVVDLADCAPMGGPYSFRTGIVEGDDGDLPGQDVLVVHEPIGFGEPDGLGRRLILDRSGGPTEDLSDQLDLGHFEPGRSGWMLENNRPLVAPVPASGKLGLWTPDADLLAAIESALP